ncbi:MAG TPA: hypothetical protein PKW98_20935, partial [Candidatus Wallbacteria bacterium]|nr:hypothetical protein [Candidatus Wallbacteria bacterium]
MKKINSINSIFLIALIIFMSFFSGCGGGGGGAQTAPGDATASGPSITLEGEIDPISLGIDASSLSPSGDLSQFSIIVLENKSYLDFQRGLAAETASSMNGPAYAPSYQQAGDFVRLVNSGAVIASSDKLNAANGKLNYSINVAINDNAPDATLALVEKSTGIAMLSAPLGCLPDKSFFTSDSSVPSAGEVSRAINYGFTNLLINDFELNSRTTVLSMANIENKISSNVNFFSSAAKKIISQDTSKNPVFSSKNSSITNISTVQKVVGSWFKDSTSVDQFSKAVTTVNTVFNSSIVSKDNK